MGDPSHGMLVTFKADDVNSADFMAQTVSTVRMNLDNSDHIVGLLAHMIHTSRHEVIDESVGDITAAAVQVKDAITHMLQTNLTLFGLTTKTYLTVYRMLHGSVLACPRRGFHMKRFCWKDISQHMQDNIEFPPLPSADQLDSPDSELIITMYVAHTRMCFIRKMLEEHEFIEIPRNIKLVFPENQGYGVMGPKGKGKSGGVMGPKGNGKHGGLMDRR